MLNSGTSFAQVAFSRYAYNDRSELTAADRCLGTDVNDTTTPVPSEQRGYQYDPIGNRIESVAAGVTTGYSTNAVNQYTALTGELSGSPAYDADGNMTATPEGMHYTYNAENRLIAAQPQTPVDGDTRVDFIYDYMGRRVQKIVYVYGSGSWQVQKELLFVYDGWNVIEEITREGGSDTNRYFVWGLDLSQSPQGAGGVGGLLAMVDDGNTHHYCFDANGNVGQLVSAANGEIAAHYEFDPFGNVVRQSGGMADDNPFRFSAKYFDEEIGLGYWGYRYYAPELGRWLNKDPMGEEGDLNLYASVRNNGINSYDFLGQYTLNEVLTEYCVKKYPSQGAYEIHTCMTTTSDQKIFDLWYQKENAQAQKGWWKNLPKCPRKLCKDGNGKWQKPSKEPEKWNEPAPPHPAELLLHPGTKLSMRSKPDAEMHANQCTYNGEGELFPNPPSAGTVDWYKPHTYTHWLHDVEPIDLADYLDWGGGVSRRKRGLVQDIWPGSVLGIGRPIHEKVRSNMAKYFEVRPLWAEPKESK